MYCKRCGQQLDDNATYCTNCGAFTENYTGPTSQPVSAPKDSNAIALVGFILSFFVALPGLICSIIGYRRAKSEGLDRGGLALAGIIISVVNMVLGFIFSMVYMSAIWALLGVTYY